MLLSISSWWEALITIEKIYWAIAIPFSLLFVIQTAMTFIGGDFDGVEADGDVDASIDGDAGIEFQFLSIKNVIAFFTIFGWVGIVCLNGEMSVPVATGIATISGLLMMLIMATIMYFMGKLVENGSLNINNAVAKTGSVYLTIPAKRGGMGKVQIKVQGFQTLDAMTDGQEIATGTMVDVVKVINENILLVKPSGN